MRHYLTRLGALPSVTTVLSETESDEDKKRLQNWVKKKEGEKIGSSKDAMNRGTSVHSLAEVFLKTESPRSIPECTDESVSHFFTPMYTILRSMGKMTWVEGPLRGEYPHAYSIRDGEKVGSVWSELGYAGCPDWIGEYQGMLTLLDLKTTDDKYSRMEPVKSKFAARGGNWHWAFMKANNQYGKFHKAAIQLVAYERAIEETLGLKLDQLMIIVARPGETQQFTLTQEDREKYWAIWMERLTRFKEMRASGYSGDAA